MNRLIPALFFLLSAFYAISNEQMGGYTDQRQQGDSSVPKIGSSYVPGTFGPRERQQGFAPLRTQRPIIQRPYGADDSGIAVAPGTKMLNHKGEDFSNMPEIAASDKSERQQGAFISEDPFSETGFQYCLRFYGN